MGTDLTRINVNITRKAATALDKTAEVEEASKTDIINRAIQLYEFFTTSQVVNGLVPALFDPETGKYCLVMISPTSIRRMPS